MYYVNREQLSVRLQIIPTIVEALQSIEAQWDESLIKDSQERAIHFTIETVTDIGSS